MRLIDADALGVGKANPDAFKERAYACGWNAVIEIIEKAPTVDAVPVVRCRECINFAKTAVNGKGFCICPASGMDITPDDFCSYGQRKMEDSHNVMKENT